MPQPLKLLIAEDDPTDAKLLVRALGRAGFSPEWSRVDTEEEFVKALHAGLDLVLSDYAMPEFGALRALELLQQHQPGIPFIIVSGTIGEETAVEAMRFGATDYLLKDRLARLGLAVTHALEQSRLRRERQQALDALGLFRTLVDQSSDAFEVLDLASGRYFDINESGCRELGYSREEMLRLSVAEVDPNATAANWAELARRVRSEGGVSGEGVHRRKDGTSFPIEFNTRLVRLNRDYLVSVVRNITERQQAEAALRVSEERLRIVTDNARVGLVMVNSEHRYAFANATYADVLGLPSANIVGLRVADVLPALYEDQIRPRLDRAFAGERVAYELHQDTPDGPRHYNVRYEPTKSAGVVQLVVVVLTDITERKQADESLRASEARFRQMAESIEEVFWMTDLEKNRIIYISPAYETVWGRRCEDLYAQPRTWLDSIQPEDRARVLQAATTRQATGGYDEIYRILRPDGTVRWIRDRAFPVKEPDGQVRRVVGVAEDITGRKKLEEQFLHAQRMEAVGTLASGVAHDLNNILAPIMMVAGLLKLQGDASPKNREMLSLIERSGQRGADIIRQLLTFSRSVPGERCLVQLKHLVREMQGIMRETFPRNITLTDSIPPDLWLVEADPTQLHQVIMNLCVNARDAMPSGGKLTLLATNVTVEPPGPGQVEGEPKPGRYVVLQVEDTGSGIPPDIIGRIFEPFFTTKAVGQGTGLGLSTVVGIVQGCGGTVKVESEPGRGTSFTIFLPASGREPDDPQRIQPAGPARGRNELILLVDDEEPIRKLGAGFWSSMVIACSRRPRGRMRSRSSWSTRMRSVWC